MNKSLYIICFPDSPEECILHIDYNHKDTFYHTKKKAIIPILLKYPDFEKEVERFQLQDPFTLKEVDLNKLITQTGELPNYFYLKYVIN